MLATEEQAKRRKRLYEEAEARVRQKPTCLAVERTCICSPETEATHAAA